MNTLLLLHVEPKRMNPLITEEGVHALGLIESILCEHGDRVKVDVVLPEGADSIQGVPMGSLAIAEPPVAVVNLFRTINAHAHHNVVALEAVTPVVVDQRGIGLDVLLNHHPLSLKIGRFPLDDVAGFVVKRSWQREGFSGVPENRKMGAPKRAFVNPLQQQG